MEITVKELTSNEVVLDVTRTTVWKDKLGKEPSESFMEKMYMSEHSPIYSKMFKIEIRGIKRWIADQLVRSHVGVTPYMATHREDRNENVGNRDELPQGTLTNLDLVLNAEAIINMSRKRLCYMAHKETRDVWVKILKELIKIDYELYMKCVPNGIYRGFCPEINNECRFCYSKEGKRWRKVYLNGRENIDIGDI